MSGGSLSYLCYKEMPEIMSHTDEMEQVEQECLARGYTDIARDVRRLIEYIKSAENRITVLSDQLQDVFKAVEWYHSADYGEDTLVKYLEQYRDGVRQ